MWYSNLLLTKPVPQCLKKDNTQKVNESMGPVPQHNSRLVLSEIENSSSKSTLRMFSPNNDECLWRIDREEGVSIEDLKSVINDKFEFIADKDREINYLNIHIDWEEAPIHQLLPYYGVYPSYHLLWFVVEYCNTVNYLILCDISLASCLFSNDIVLIMEISISTGLPLQKYLVATTWFTIYLFLSSILIFIFFSSENLCQLYIY